MKMIRFFGMTCAAALLMQACNDGSTDAVQSANETNEIKIDSARHSGGQHNMTVSEADAKFSVKAASGGLMEVQLGELAQQKASSQRVKDFGAMMVRDHTKANEELKSIADMKKMSLPPAPGEEHMKHIQNLTKKSGKEFDRDYMSMMVEDHEEDVEAFEEASKNGKDPEIKAFAAKTLPILKAHLDSAKAIRDGLNK